MLITFKRNGQKNCTQVFAEVNLGLPIERNLLSFSWECGHQYTSALLAEHLNNLIRDRAEEIRKEAYEQGWADAKAKRRKQKYFSSAF